MANALGLDGLIPSSERGRDADSRPQETTMQARFLALTLAFGFAAAALSTPIAAQLPEDTAERDSRNLAGMLNREYGDSIVALPLAEYQDQQASVRMIPGQLLLIEQLRDLVAALQADLEEHKKVMKALIEENEQLRQQLGSSHEQ